jgi:hypothetical protein
MVKMLKPHESFARFNVTARLGASRMREHTKCMVRNPHGY